MPILIDLRLIDTSIELSTLERQLELIEDQINRRKEEAYNTLQSNLQIFPKEEHDIAFQEYTHEMDFVLPRTLRNPFLVSLFAVYESTVTEIARLIQEKQKRRISIDDLNGNFLQRSKKYYRDVVEFRLSMSNQSWQRVTMISDLRNAIAHSNGRLEMMKKSTRNKMDKLLKLSAVRKEFGFVVVEEAFLKETFAVVKDDLTDLVDRYKKWDES